MTPWELPQSLSVGGKEWNIRTDFRAVLDALRFFNDPEYEMDEKFLICLTIIYIDFDDMPPELYEEAAEKATEFIDMGIQEDKAKKPHMMDWEQDGQIIIPAVNRVLGREVRADKYLHWWTFLGAYLEIGESLFQQVLAIRQKKMKGKKLEKWEKEFYSQNKSLVDLKARYTAEELEEQRRLNEILG
nr:MAG TPA: hypothetical protein [Caudoviricetes sp.]